MKGLTKERTRSISGFRNPPCYANARADCSVQMTGEHPLSRGLLKRVDQGLGVLSKKIDVRNMAFQPPRTVQSLGIKGQESRILCAHHNSALGDFDNETLKIFDAFEKQHYAAAGRDIVVQSLYTVDGDRFERFLLKALCGGLYAGLFPEPEVSRMKDVEPPLDWLETIYRNEPFPKGHGLYWAPGPFTADNTIIKWGPLLLANGDYLSIHGLRFWLFGFEFTLLAPGPEPRAVEALRGQIYRPSSLTIAGSGTRIRLTWTEGPASAGITLGVKPERALRRSSWSMQRAFTGPLRS